MDESQVIKVDLLVCGNMECRDSIWYGSPRSLYTAGNLQIDFNEVPEEIELNGKTFDFRNAVIMRTPHGLGTVSLSAMSVPKGKVVFVSGWIYALGLHHDEESTTGIL